MAKIVFTDADGPVTFENHQPIPGNRLTNFRPHDASMRSAAYQLSARVRHVFSFGAGHGCTFDVTQIPVWYLDDMLRLERHLLDGGTVELRTEDAAARVYPTCMLAPGAESPAPSLSDPVLLEYTMHFALVDARGSLAVPMLCIYDAGPGGGTP